MPSQQELQTLRKKAVKKQREQRERELERLKTAQFKAVHEGAEYFEAGVMAAVMATLMAFTRTILGFKYPFSFFGDIGNKFFRNFLGIRQVYRSDRPNWVKGLVIGIRVTTFIFILAAVGNAIKPVAEFLAKSGALKAVVGSASPFFFTAALAIFTIISAWDLVNKVRERRRHPWKITKIDDIKLRNKIVKTVSLMVMTSIIWPMFKFGIGASMVAGKLVLASNPIGWALAGILVATLLTVSIYKAYSRTEMEHELRKAARNRVNEAKDPEKELNVDLYDLKSETKKSLTTKFKTKNPTLEESTELDAKVNNYLTKGGIMNRIRSLVGARSPLQREAALAIRSKVNLKFEEQLATYADKSPPKGSAEYQKLQHLYSSREVLHANYSRDYYEKTKIINELAQVDNFNPYNTLGFAMNEKPWPYQVKRAAAREIKKAQDLGEAERAAKIQEVEDAAYCLSEKRHRKQFNIMFAAHRAHKKDDKGNEIYNPYSILRDGQEGSMTTDNEIAKYYDNTKGKKSGEELARVEWAYEMLKSTASRTRYDTQCNLIRDFEQKLVKEESNYYIILGINHDGTPAEVSAATVAEKYHQKLLELRDTDHQSVMKRQLLKYACDTLSDPDTKSEYDLKLRDDKVEMENKKQKEVEKDEFFKKWQEHKHIHVPSSVPVSHQGFMEHSEKKELEEGKTSVKKPKEEDQESKEKTKLTV